MTSVDISVTGHWLNAWFMRLFARPYMVIDGKRHRVRWSEPNRINVDADEVELGAGIRYFDRGGLLGFEPERVEIQARAAQDPDATVSIILRNGFLNHTPFHVQSIAPGIPADAT
jgi:hypothetical protein